MWLAWFVLMLPALSLLRSAQIEPIAFAIVGLPALCACLAWGVLVVAVQTGRNLARIVYVILALSLVAVIVRMSILEFGTVSPVWLVPGLVGAGLLAGSVALLCRPAAAAWFHPGETGHERAR
jgi:hypothetical protein